MVSKFVTMRNKFIASLVQRYTEDLGSVLDLGCGEGILLKYIRKPVFYHGVDTNYIGKSNLIENSDIQTWESDKVYDTIVLQEVLEHLPLPETDNAIPFLQRVQRFMHDESTLIVSVPNFHRLTNLLTHNPKYLDETHNTEYWDGYLDLIVPNIKYRIVEKHYWLLYLPFEKYIGWLVPDFIRNWILKRRPTWASHIIYIIKKDKNAKDCPPCVVIEGESAPIGCYKYHTPECTFQGDHGTIIGGY